MKSTNLHLRSVTLILAIISNIGFAQKKLSGNEFTVGGFAGVQGYDSGVGIELGTPLLWHDRI